MDQLAVLFLNSAHICCISCEILETFTTILMKIYRFQMSVPRLVLDFYQNILRLYLQKMINS